MILGDKGEFRDRLEEHVAEYRPDRPGQLPGFLDRAAYHDCLAASSAFLNLSTYLDPFPTVNLESMALGVPVIGTRLGGTPEAILDDETGFLVNPFDVEDVAAKALRLIETPRCVSGSAQAAGCGSRRSTPSSRWPPATRRSTSADDPRRVAGRPARQPRPGSGSASARRPRACS